MACLVDTSFANLSLEILTVKYYWWSVCRWKKTMFVYSVSYDARTAISISILLTKFLPGILARSTSLKSVIILSHLGSVTTLLFCSAECGFLHPLTRTFIPPNGSLLIASVLKIKQLYQQFKNSIDVRICIGDKDK